MALLYLCTHDYVSKDMNDIHGAGYFKRQEWLVPPHKLSQQVARMQKLSKAADICTKIMQLPLWRLAL